MLSALRIDGLARIYTLGCGLASGLVPLPRNFSGPFAEQSALA